MQSGFKSAARAAFHHAGGTWATRYRYRNGARILMYHRFPAQSELEAQCAHLQKYYRPVSLTDVGHWLRREGQLPPQAVVFTVDDGYRDFFLNAFPVLAAYSIPAMVFLATDMLDQGTCLWVDWVRVLFQTVDAPEVQIDLPGRGTARFPISAAAYETKEALKLIPNRERLAFLESLPGLLGVKQAPACPEEYAPLTWDEVRQMHQGGMEFGAHTKSHPILSRLDSRGAILDELAGSKARIERETGHPVRHFCYPNGRLRDITPETLDVVRECGFLTAVTAEKGINFAGADAYQLRRIHQEPVTPALQYAHQVAGLAR